ncbi:MerR family transcriptional regulator [Kutzneria buriramensis]|uniref:UvrABC system protein A n=1 Tax=Kutzneria buriramensis TaxID=1045776 RepID=A0A3E0G546_9PSEU|nr:MerR family transcriptional regulator [Kutzneria buriramensis]REH17875.1 MerR-like DNA binding protein [Kutzneria buriramensis]
MSSRDGARAGGHIEVGNAREDNLKNVSLRLSKGELTVFAGMPGSGKFSVVFGTIAVESQRQLNESFPAFIRNRLPRYARPDAEVKENLSTAIVVDQRPVGGNSRSTVGTMTDIYSVLRVLFSRHGKPTAGPYTSFSFNDPNGMCPACEGLGRTVRLNLSKLIDESKSLNEGTIQHPSFAKSTFQWQLYAESGLFDRTCRSASAAWRTVRSCYTAAGSRSTAAAATASTRTSTRASCCASPGATSRRAWTRSTNATVDEHGFRGPVVTAAGSCSRARRATCCGPRTRTPRGAWPGIWRSTPPGGGMADELVPIEQVAEWFQMRVSAPRYYEDEDLLTTQRRNGRRHFTPADLRRLTLVRTGG